MNAWICSYEDDKYENDHDIMRMTMTMLNYKF